MLSWYWVMSTALPALCLQDSVRRGITQTATPLLKGPPPHLEDLATFSPLGH